MSDWHIFVYRSGRCRVGRSDARGAIIVASGTKTELVEVLAVHGRHGYDGVTFLAPGVPEATTERAALVALKRWQSRLQRSLRGRRRPAPRAAMEARP